MHNGSQVFQDSITVHLVSQNIDTRFDGSPTGIENMVYENWVGRLS